MMLWRDFNDINLKKDQMIDISFCKVGLKGPVPLFDFHLSNSISGVSVSIFRFIFSFDHEDY